MRLTRPLNTNHPRRGTALAILAVSLVLIFSVMALSLDGGLMMAEQRHARAVADASAYAAAGLLYKNYSTGQGLDTNGTSKSIALAIASGNGYANDGTTSTVTVNIPPLSGNFSGKSGYAEVIVSYNLPKCFSAIWGSGTLTVGARSVCRGKNTNPNIGFLLLDPTMKDSLSSTGGAGVTVKNGSAIIDSNNSEAVKFTGTGQVVASKINITGSGYSVQSGTFQGTVKTSVAATPDPLASLAEPSMTGMTVQSTSQLQINGGSQTISPGVYTGGISMSGGSLTMNPGIYYLNGGGFKVNGSSTITGSGVMIYNAPVANNDSINLTGSGPVSLTPPTSGTYAGISIFQNRTATAPLILTGSGSLNVTGGIYAAAAAASLTGSSSTNVAGSFFIADSAIITGTGQINVGITGTGSGGRDLRIVE